MRGDSHPARELPSLSDLELYPDINAVADIYGGSTTLGLAATSIHPWRAGVLEPLLQLLIDRGAAFASPDAGSSTGIVHVSG